MGPAADKFAMAAGRAERPWLLLPVGVVVLVVVVVASLLGGSTVSIAVSRDPAAAVPSPDGRPLYVTAGGAGTVTVVDTEAGVVGAPISPPAVPTEDAMAALPLLARRAASSR